MRNRKFRNVFIMTALTMALFFSAGISQAAQVSILGPSTVMAGGSFTFDVIIDDLGGLPNIDGFDLMLALTPQTNAEFQITDFTTPNSAYVFSGDSDGILYTPIGNPYILGVGDITGSGSGVAATDAIGSLMATIGIDVTSANFCEWYTVSIHDGVPSQIIDTDLNPSPITLAGGNYSFHVVPIPGAIWLLGTGLIGLVGLRRKTRT